MTRPMIKTALVAAMAYLMAAAPAKAVQIGKGPDAPAPAPKEESKPPAPPAPTAKKKEEPKPPASKETAPIVAKPALQPTPEPPVEEEKLPEPDEHGVVNYRPGQVYESAGQKYRLRIPTPRVNKLEQQMKDVQELLKGKTVPQVKAMLAGASGITIDDDYVDPDDQESKGTKITVGDKSVTLWNTTGGAAKPAQVFGALIKLIQDNPAERQKLFEIFDERYVKKSDYRNGLPYFDLTTRIPVRSVNWDFLTLSAVWIRPIGTSGFGSLFRLTGGLTHIQTSLTGYAAVYPVLGAGLGLYAFGGWVEGVLYTRWDLNPFTTGHGYITAEPIGIELGVRNQFAFNGYVPPIGISLDVGPMWGDKDALFGKGGTNFNLGLSYRF